MCVYLCVIVCARGVCGVRVFYLVHVVSVRGARSACTRCLVFGTSRDGQMSRASASCFGRSGNQKFAGSNLDLTVSKPS